MTRAVDINEPIIEALYCEALVLADEVRSAFDLSPPRSEGAAQDLLRVALSTEGLKTTTRMMHVLAWLLNHRAFFAGELSEFQLRRHSTLPVDRPSDPDNLARLEPATCDLIAETEALHARIARLDDAWRDRFEMRPAAVLRLRERLHERLVRSIEGG
ncbi:MAG: DUF1465 family protein [Sphingomonadales bacterium]|nr:DUF1465 family protein [Sphingomonadales bacterium]MBD3774960.1 DUF1465 family protein [Paracoccaceae bacterium]